MASDINGMTSEQKFGGIVIVDWMMSISNITWMQKGQKTIETPSLCCCAKEKGVGMIVTSIEEEVYSLGNE